MIFLQYIKQATGLTFIKEHKFHPVRRWRMDYACLEHRICIEVEGGVFTHGRHTRGPGFISDMEKYNFLTALGWKLIRTTPTTLCSQQTVNFVQVCAMESPTESNLIVSNVRKAKTQTKITFNRKATKHTSIDNTTPINAISVQAYRSLIKAKQKR